MDRKPLVSIGMPVYNEAQWIRQAFDSLLGQSFPDFELIVSDNDSTDFTWDILQEYAVSDSRILLHRQSASLDIGAHFQFVLEQARGEYFMWAAGHDLWSSDLLEVLVGEMENNANAVICLPRSALIDDENKSVESYKAIDTRVAQSAAGRILTWFRQPRSSHAIYGLFRRDVLLQTLPWPGVIGIDHIILARAILSGDIIGNPTVQWFRRQNRVETGQEKVRRHSDAFKVTGLAARYPYLTFRITLATEFLKVNGSYREKIALWTYAVSRLFLKPTMVRLLAQEFFRGSLAFLSSKNCRKGVI